MKIYVAGSSKEFPRVKRVMAELRAAGHEITFDWVAHIESVGGNALPTGALRRAEALDDIRGMILCELFLYLHPAPGIVSSGATFEFGFNMGMLYTSNWTGEEDTQEDQDLYARGVLGKDDAALLQLLNPKQLPVIVSYETEIYSGPCLFDATVQRAEILDDKILFIVAHLGLHEMP